MHEQNNNKYCRYRTSRYFWYSLEGQKAGSSFDG